MVHTAARETYNAANAFISYRRDDKNDISLYFQRMRALKEKYNAIHGLVDVSGPSGSTPLLIACLQGSEHGTRAMIAFGADPTAEGEADHEDDVRKIRKCQCVEPCDPQCADLAGGKMAAAVLAMNRPLTLAK